MEAQAKEFLSKFSTKKDAITACDEIIKSNPHEGYYSDTEFVVNSNVEFWQTLKTLIEGMEEKRDLCDCVDELRVGIKGKNYCTECFKESI